jgi:pimeloyl-ACP methyl ester carboxylesterase
MTDQKIASKTIVFIHGLFINPKNWEGWKAYFEAQGYTCYIPAMPYHTGETKDLWEHIDPKLGKVNFDDAVNSFAKFIDSLQEKPIAIGHSVGGLIAQKLVDMNKVAAGVSIDGAAPMGIVTTKWSFWKSNFRVVDYLKGNSVFKPTADWFYYAFGNTLTREASDKAFHEFVIPESRNIARGTLLVKIHFKKPHQPLLFIAGEKDHIIPASLNKKNFNAYKDTSSVRDFKEFPGRGHYICAEPNWQEVAAYVSDWLKK